MTRAAAMAHTGPERAEALTREEFELFYNRTAPALRSYIRRLAGNAALADEFLQESYVRLLTAPPLADAPRKSYLYRTATNLVTDHRRSQGRQRHWWQLTAPRAEAQSAPVEFSSDIDRLFQTLAGRERALLWLAYVAGEGHREIAEILGLKESSVKVLLYRARRKMEAILTSHGFGGSHD